MLALLQDPERGTYLGRGSDRRRLSTCAGALGPHSDLDLEFVDASVLAIAERLGEDKLATLDRHHFAVVRLRHTDTRTALCIASQDPRTPVTSRPTTAGASSSVTSPAAEAWV